MIKEKIAFFLKKIPKIFWNYKKVVSLQRGCNINATQTTKQRQQHYLFIT